MYSTKLQFHFLSPLRGPATYPNMVHFGIGGTSCVYLVLKDVTLTYLRTLTLTGPMSKSPEKEVQSFTFIFLRLLEINDSFLYLSYIST